MAKNTLSNLPILVIDRKSGQPLHRQIYDGFRQAILNGDLRPGQRTPSSRELSTELAVSRFPVLNAFAQLLAEGYFESRHGAGTFVSRSLPESQLIQPYPQPVQPLQPAQPAPQQPLLPQHPVQLNGNRPVSRRSALYPPFEQSPALKGWGSFGVHQPALDQFPFQLWSTLVARHSRNPHASAIHQVNPLGSEKFRHAIANYLRAARGVKCDPSQIMVVSGSQQALDITTRVLFDPGNAVWIEDPGYRLERFVLTAAQCRLIPVPVDGEGLNVSAGIDLCRNARAAFVTPSHQYPLGSTMSASRRIQLLNWAQSSGAWIIEDDYDSEYRYETQPIASLHGLDVNHRVIYIGTFSKVLFPSIRLGYIVIPPDLVDRFASVRWTMDIFPPYLYQEVLTEFINEGHFSRHLRRMRQVYSERRTALVDSLKTELGDLIQIHGKEAGMHLAITLTARALGLNSLHNSTGNQPQGSLDSELALRAARERLWLWPLSPAYLSPSPHPFTDPATPPAGANGLSHLPMPPSTPPRQGFVLGFGSTAPEQIPRAVQHIVTLLKP